MLKNSLPCSRASSTATCERDSDGGSQCFGVFGWGVTPEFGYVSNYEYHSGGYMDANGNYVREGGYHIVYSLAGEQFRFDESDGTWRLGTN